MTGQAAIRLREFEPGDDRAALELEQRCPQGQAFQIAFARDSFARRTAGFAQARLIGAWQGVRLIAIGGGAIKDLRWQGGQTKGLMLYDFRVDPQFRREGVARMLSDDLIEWARPHAEIGYAFAMGDNRAIQEMARQWIGADTAPGFDLLAYPTHRRAGGDRLADISPQDNHARYLKTQTGVPLECDTDAALASQQVVGAWGLGQPSAGGCCAWTTRGVLEEVVLGLPPTLRAASWLLGGEMARRLRLPHVPRIGERLRSWMLFDGHAADALSARQLYAAVAQRARAAGIDHCHVVLAPGSPLLAALQRDLPRGFAPVIPFTIMARTLDGKPLALPAPVIDPRDI